MLIKICNNELATSVLYYYKDRIEVGEEKKLNFTILLLKQELSAKVAQI